MKHKIKETLVWTAKERHLRASECNIYIVEENPTKWYYKAVYTGFPGIIFNASLNLLVKDLADKEIITIPAAREVVLECSVNKQWIDSKGKTYAIFANDGKFEKLRSISFILAGFGIISYTSTEKSALFPNYGIIAVRSAFGDSSWLVVDAGYAIIVPLDEDEPKPRVMTITEACHKYAPCQDYCDNAVVTDSQYSTEGVYFLDNVLDIRKKSQIIKEYVKHSSMFKTLLEKFMNLFSE